jgi:hypothetical protein
MKQVRKSLRRQKRKNRKSFRKGGAGRDDRSPSQVHQDIMHGYEYILEGAETNKTRMAQEQYRQTLEKNQPIIKAVQENVNKSLEPINESLKSIQNSLDIINNLLRAREVRSSTH